MDNLTAGVRLRADNKPEEMIVMAIFEDRQTYRATPKTRNRIRWCRRLREHLEADPEWEDGEITTAS